MTSYTKRFLIIPSCVYDIPAFKKSRSQSMPVRRVGVGILLVFDSRCVCDVSSTHARILLENISKVFRISRRKCDTVYTEIN